MWGGLSRIAGRHLTKRVAMTMVWCMSWRIGKLAGYPISLRFGFWLLLAAVGFGFFGGRGGFGAILMMLLLFGSVLLHEHGHAVVASKRGVGIAGIEFGFFGGAAKMTSAPQTAQDEIAIAAAGPAVSVLLSAAAFGITSVWIPARNASASAWWLYDLINTIGWMNVIVAGFNMLPALPMDGGRILRAVLSRWSDYVTATDRAVLVARGFAIGFVVLGLAYSTHLLFLAPVLWMWGSRERMLARVQAHLYERSSAGYVTRRFASAADEGFAWGGAYRQPGQPFRTTSGPGFGPVDPFELLAMLARGPWPRRPPMGPTRIVIDIDPDDSRRS